MTEPTDKEKCLNIADQCTATASNDITASILVDGGSGTLRELLNDAADAIRAGWAMVYVREIADMRPNATSSPAAQQSGAKKG